MRRLLIDELTCPRCGHRGSFHIDIIATAYVDDSGPCVESDYYWDSDSGCACLTCNYEASAGAFAGMAAVTMASPSTIRSARAALETLRSSCEEALDGRWDRSDDGFKDMIEVAERAIARLGEVRS